MAVQGAWTILNLAKLKVMESTINLAADNFNVVLCSSSQALSASFTGSSGQARYADLTGELATANGYTVGGVNLASPTLTLAGATVTFNGGNPSWTLTGSGITFKYAVIIDESAANKDILAYCDMDTSGGSVSPIAGSMEIQENAGGILTWT